MHVTRDDLRRQHALEDEMLRASEARYREAVTAAVEAGRQDETGYGVRMLHFVVGELAGAIATKLAEVKAGGAGRRHSAIAYVSLLEPEAVAFIAAKAVIAGITERRPATGVAVQIGARLEDEVRFRAVREQDKELMKRLVKLVEKATSYRHRKNTVSAILGREGFEYERWPDETRLAIGVWLLDLLEQHTDLITREMHIQDGRAPGYRRADCSHGKLGLRGPKQAGKRQYIIRPTEACMAWIDGCREEHALLHPQWWPTVVPPRRWRSPFGGGYRTQLPRPIPLIKPGQQGTSQGYIEELRNCDLADVYEAINAVQDTPYAINGWLLGRLEEAVRSGVSFPGVDIISKDTLPPKPADVEENPEARKAWRKGAAQWHEDYAASLSKRVQLAAVLSQARRFREEPALYLPCQLDFRGRLYYLPLLSPQGPDVVRGLLQFAQGRPIEDETAAAWLMIHIANAAGQDKSAYEDRIGWVQANEARIVQAGTEPWADRWWTELDCPWQFLAAAHDYAELLAAGYGYVSHVPVMMDGTCNGLQHLSAMLRDARGGSAVNLTPRETPADIYGEVAAVVTAKLRLIASANGEDAEIARRWLDVEIGRKLTKRSVMCLPYGLGKFSSRAYVDQAVRERLKELGHNPFRTTTEDGKETDGVWGAVAFLAPLVWEAIGEVVVAAREAMGWMQQWAAAVATEGLPVTWMTPDGLPVQQRYRKTEEKRVDTVISGGIRLTLTLRSATAEIDRNRQRTGISPNFVHSLDAAAMRSYVRTAKDNGLSSFALVHDSYGAHAADVETMQACLREAFVELYEAHDVLEELRASLEPLVPPEVLAGLPPVPPKGSLDLAQVRDSAFFFA